MIFPWSGLPLCKHCWAKRVARDAPSCTNCGGNLPGQYWFPIDHLRLYMRNPGAMMEPLIGWLAMIVILVLILGALSGSFNSRG